MGEKLFEDRRRDELAIHGLKQSYSHLFRPALFSIVAFRLHRVVDDVLLHRVVEGLKVFEQRLLFSESVLKDLRYLDLSLAEIWLDHDLHFVSDLNVACTLLHLLIDQKKVLAISLRKDGGFERKAIGRSLDWDAAAVTKSLLYIEWDIDDLPPEIDLIKVTKGSLEFFLNRGHLLIEI
jgi:hypothetical protein